MKPQDLVLKRLLDSWASDLHQHTTLMNILGYANRVEQIHLYKILESQSRELYRSFLEKYCSDRSRGSLMFKLLWHFEKEVLFCSDHAVISPELDGCCRLDMIRNALAKAGESSEPEEPNSNISLGPVKIRANTRTQSAPEKTSNKTVSTSPAPSQEYFLSQHWKKLAGAACALAAGVGGYFYWSSGKPSEVSGNSPSGILDLDTTRGKIIAGTAAAAAVTTAFAGYHFWKKSKSEPEQSSSSEDRYRGSDMRLIHEKSPSKTPLFIVVGVLVVCILIGLVYLYTAQGTKDENLDRVPRDPEKGLPRPSFDRIQTQVEGRATLPDI